MSRKDFLNRVKKVTGELERTWVRYELDGEQVLVDKDRVDGLALFSIAVDNAVGRKRDYDLSRQDRAFAYGKRLDPMPPDFVPDATPEEIAYWQGVGEKPESIEPEELPDPDEFTLDDFR